MQWREAGRNKTDERERERRKKTRQNVVQQRQERTNERTEEEEEKKSEKESLAPAERLSVFLFCIDGDAGYASAWWWMFPLSLSLARSSTIRES